MVLALTGCEQNHYDTTVTDAKVEAVQRRIELNGNEWAINELKTILKSEASHPRGNLLLAELMLRQGREKADVDKYLQRATAKHAPIDTRLWATATQCQVLFERGDKGEALAAAQEIAADAAREQWPERQRQFAADLVTEVKLATTLQNSEQADSAATLAALEALVAEYPEHAQTRISYGALLRDSGNFDQAAGQFQIIIDKHDNDWPAVASRIGLAKTYRARGDISKAEQLAAEARALGQRIGVSDELLNQHLDPIENTP